MINKITKEEAKALIDSFNSLELQFNRIIHKKHVIESFEDGALVDGELVDIEGYEAEMERYASTGLKLLAGRICELLASVGYNVEYSGSWIYEVEE